MHLSSQYASHLVVDRVFDGLYGLFLNDLEKFGLEEDERKKIIQAKGRELEKLIRNEGGK